jgi:hypothetical protein
MRHIVPKDGLPAVKPKGGLGRFLFHAISRLPVLKTSQNADPRLLGKRRQSLLLPSREGKMRAAIYLRVSTDEETTENQETTGRLIRARVNAGRACKGSGQALWPPHD